MSGIWVESQRAGCTSNYNVQISSTLKIFFLHKISRCIHNLIYIAIKYLSDDDCYVMLKLFVKISVRIV